MEIHTASPQGSPVMITVLYVAIAIGAITGFYYYYYWENKNKSINIYVL